MIKVENLTRKYGSFTAVDSINFEIPKGQIVGLLGHNGAGKTTTLKMLTGYLEASSGKISIGSLDLEKNLIAIQKNLGYLPEQSPLYPEMTIWQYLEYVADLRGISESQKNAAIQDAIKATDLGIKATQKINTLSKGYRQRVGVAQAIIHKPEILVLDEPTSGLDPSQIIAMRNLIKELAKHSTVILSTHIMQEVEAICDRVLIILNGRLALDESLENLQKNNVINISLEQDLSSVKSLLSPIEGVSEVFEDKTEGTIHHYSIETTKDSLQNLTPVIAQTICAKGWSLYALKSEQRDLESIFRNVNKEMSGGSSHHV